MTTFLQLVVVGLSTGSAFALVGMSLVLVYRTTGIVNFAQGVFVVLGGLFTFRLSGDLPLALATSVAVVVAALLASLLGVLAVGIRGRTTSLASTIITLGVAFVAEALLLLEFGDIPRSYPGISDHAWDVGGVLVQPQYVLIAGVALAAAGVLTVFLRHTIVGQALVACSDSRRAAELVGLNVRSLAVVAFVGAGALCALGGALLAPSSPMTYSSDVAITVNGFAAAVFGGLGSIRLALLGGYALGILEQFVVGYVDPQYSLVIALVVMLVLIGWRARAEIATHGGPPTRLIRRRARPLARAGSGRRDRLCGRGRLLAAVPPLHVRRLAVRPDGSLRACHDRPHAVDGIRGPDLPRPGCVLPDRRVHLRAVDRRPRPGHARDRSECRDQPCPRGRSPPRSSPPPSRP